MSKLTHLDGQGRPAMVDVSDKSVTAREAVAEAFLSMSAEGFAHIGAENPKGDVLTIATLAGITGGKQTANLIPLCHPLPLTKLAVEIEPDPDLPGVRIQARAKTDGKTGVEMEALTAVTTAALTVYDMLKAVDRAMEIGPVRLIEKSGGKSGLWQRTP